MTKAKAVSILLIFLSLAQWACNSVTSELPAQTGAEVAALGESPRLRASPELAGNGTVATPETVALRLLKHTLVLIKTKYYDPERVDWQKMAVHAVDALQNGVAEIVADFDKPIEAQPQAVNLRVNTRSQSFSFTQVKDWGTAHELCAEVMGFVLASLREEKEAADLEYMMINGMLGTLDPHSVLLTPKMYNDMMTSHGGFGGLGIMIGIRDNTLTIISPYEGTPASMAGLKAGDQILRIGEESTVNMLLHEAVDRLRGDPGTTVEIVVMRKGWAEGRHFSMVRALIEIRSLLTHFIAEDRIAYVKIKSFEKNTAEDMRAKLAEMRKQHGEIKGLILDMRFNAGGLLTQAVMVADTFLNRGQTIVISEGIGGSGREVELARDYGTEPNYPIVVLVNPGSASASEIVAGALRNNNRAIILGERTFGKGSVQVLRDNEDGSAVKLTIAQYLTPGDISIQGFGIPPDIEVVPVLVSADEGIDLFISENIRREGNLELTLVSDKARMPEEPSLSVRYLYDLSETERDSESYVEDFEIRLAREILRRAESSERTALLGTSPQVVAPFHAEQDQVVAKALAALGVDWSKPAKATPSQPFTVSIAIVEDAEKSAALPLAAQEGVLRAGAEVKLHATVTNTGDASIHQLAAITHANNPVFDDRELVFGTIKPGESRTWDLTLKIPRGQESRGDKVRLTFVDANGPLSQESTVDAVIQGLPKPSFACSYWIDDRSQGNGDGVVQVGETASFMLYVENLGRGDAEEVVAAIRNESGSALFLAKGRESLGRIPSGESRIAEMRFDVKGVKEGGETIDFVLTLYDSDFGTLYSETVRLDVAAQARTEAAPGWVQLQGPTEIVAAPRANAMPIAKGKGEMVLRRDRLAPDPAFVGVSWDVGERDVRGWVTADRVNLIPAEHNSEVDQPRMLTPNRPPIIVFDSVPLTTTQEALEVTGTISDDGVVHDYRVYLWHRDGLKIHNQKLDYGIGGRSEKRFAFEVPLRPGSNIVTVVARDDQKLEQSAVLYVSRP